MGRDYSVPFVIGSDPLVTKTVMLKKGSNVVNGEEWDRIKTHPIVQQLMDTDHDYYMTRDKMIAGNDSDMRWAVLKVTENLSGRKHKKLEVEDFRPARPSQYEEPKIADIAYKEVKKVGRPPKSATLNEELIEDPELEV
jgi:hypothetical protein